MSAARTPYYGWVIVAAGALIGCVAIGSLFSLAVFLQPIAEESGWSRTGVSFAMTLDFLAMGLAAFGWGALVDRFGPRGVVCCGAVLLSAGLAAASTATELLWFQLAYGLVAGVGAGAIFAPLMVTVSGWFERRRSLAVSLVSAGMGAAPMIVSPFARWLLSNHDWRAAMLLIATLAALLMLPASLLIRRPPVVVGDSAPDAGAVGTGNAPDRAGQDSALPSTARLQNVGEARSTEGMSVRQALSSRPFLILGATFFLCCACHSGPIFHTVSYALACGLPPMVAVTIYSTEGLAGLAGRLIFGLAGDRFGARRAVVAGLLIQALAGGSYYFTREIGEFYAVAVIFGMAYGGVMPLYAVLAREFFPPRIMGTVFGAATALSSLGMAAGPVVGGWLFDRYGSYSGLYVSSLLLGLLATGLALTFPSKASGSPGALIRDGLRPAAARYPGP